MRTMSPNSKPHVLILGGGFAGLYTAWGLEKRLGQVSMDITLVEPNSYMTYQPLLPEVAGGEIDPRTVMVELRRALKYTDVFRGTMESLDCRAKTATLASISGERRQVSYDHVVFALGAITRTFPTPGLAEQAVGFKTLEEALYVRDKVLDNVGLAAATSDPEERTKALTVVFVGGGYTGVEALSELLDLAKLAVDEYPVLQRSDLRWILIEALDRVAPEIGPGLSKWTLEQLRRRGVDVRLNTTMKSCTDGNVVLSTGETFPAGTIVWTAGVKPNPVLDATNVPRGPKGHVSANARLQVVEEDGTVVDGAWAAGDNAQVPDLTAENQPAWYPPNAQNALRQARLLAGNIAAAVQHREPAEYRHKSLGAVASFGVGRGAAVVKGVELKGRLAWFVDRFYHGAAVPTMHNKWRIFTSWASGAFAARDITSVSAAQDPREAFVRAVKGQ
ncbi:NAD(P)/FAD-dependent oxidoreductase [Arthrobacter sp. GCM10027362]|uniref:NAD(P)/FAD-dependent oxidoreductase n=1 Tax=Arthrobacter sp. GCM10027362 TaxID=3273379 RepID=UPI00363FA67C